MAMAGKLNDLLAQVARGNEASFAELYQETSAKLYGVALRILRSKDVAEDVLQDAYFKIWAKAGDFDPTVAPALAWMAAIVRNRALDETRRRKVRPTVDDSDLDQIAGENEHPLVGLERDDDVKRLFRCLEGLEADKKEMVRLAYLNGLSREDLAVKFNRPEGTIKTWLRRSLAQLKGCLEA